MISQEPTGQEDTPRAAEPRKIMPGQGEAPADPPTEESVRASRMDASPPLAGAWVTLTLAFINIFVFLAMLLSAGGGVLTNPKVETLVSWGAMFGPKVQEGEFWRLLTSNYVHIGLLHIVMNMWCLLAIGPLCERAFGKAGYFVLYTLSGLGGALASLCIHADLVSAGASGAIFGIVGGMLGPVVFRQDATAMSRLKPHARSMTAFVLYNLVFGLFQPGVDIAAHVGGLATGFICGSLLSLAQRPRRDKPWLKPLVTTSVAAGGLIVVFALVIPVSGYGDRLGAELSYGGSDLFYREPVTKAEALRLKDYLSKIGLFDGKDKSLQIRRTGSTYEFRMVVKEGMTEDAELNDFCRQLSKDLSREVFNGAAVSIHLCDDNFKTIRIVTKD